MPNWCYNHLSIVGDKKDVNKFKKILQKKEGLEVLVKKKDLETYRKETLSSLKKDGSANKDMSNYINIGTMPIKEFIENYKHLCFDEKGNACNVPNDNMLHKFHPMPIELVNTTSPCSKNSVLMEKYGATNWYDWNCANWGTKWDVEVCEDYESDSNGEIYLSFDSAWSPPVEWLKKVSEDYPKINFTLEYEEGGCAFKGVLEICIDNGVFDDRCWEWNGDCGECDTDYTNEGHCKCEDDNGNKLVWGEEEEEEDNPCAV